MEAVQESMARACTQGGKRVYAIDPDILHCDEEDEVREMQKAAWDLREIHKQACKSIWSIAVLMHGCSAVPNLEAYINAYLLWYACMNAISEPGNDDPQHRKHEAAQYFKRMPSRKLTVMLAAVCLWSSVKCSDSIRIRTEDVAKLMAAVHRERGDDGLFYYRLQDLRDTENAMLHLLDFDLLRNQQRIDSMEKIIRAQFAEDYGSKETQRQILRMMFLIFDEVADKML
jgi:hypothetical protein